MARVVGRVLLGALLLTFACGGREKRSSSESDAGGAGATGGSTSHAGTASTLGGFAAAGASDPGGAPAAGTSGDAGSAGAIAAEPLPYCNGANDNDSDRGCAKGEECRINLAGIPQCSKCGGVNEPCCQATANACLAGGCCVAGKCVADGAACGVFALGQCSAGHCAGCGDLGQICCGSPEGSAICGNAQLYCQLTAGNPSTHTCVACGGPGEACCEHGACGGGACCSADPAHLDQRRCVPQGQACSNGASCDAQSCGGCGKPDQPCCPDGRPNYVGLCTTPFTDCNAPNGDNKYACEACGMPGGRPCIDGGCRSGQRNAATNACQ